MGLDAAVRRSYSVPEDPETPRATRNFRQKLGKTGTGTNRVQVARLGRRRSGVGAQRFRGPPTRAGTRQR